MTDRHRSVLVVLDRDVRSDDLEVVLSAIRMIKGVASVEPGPVTDVRDHLAREVVRRELEHELREVLARKKT